METLFSFLVNASAGIVLFYAVYWLFLRKETFYKANRWFLLVALFLAVFLPLFPLQYSVLVEQQNQTTVFQTISDTFKDIPVVAETSVIQKSFSWQQVVLIVYLTGAAIFLLRLLTQTFILIHLMIKYRIKSLEGVRIVENEKYGLPFSFFNVIFINPKFHKQDDLPEILAHEKVHIRENHWFDLLLIELLTVIFWFNPFIWFFERSIKQNHEYLADKGVLAQGHEIGRYQAILLNQLMGMQIIGITNNLNFALNTNRLKMMMKKKTSRVLGVKFLWTIPVLALLFIAFAEPQYRYTESEFEDENISIQEHSATQKTVKIKGLVFDYNNNPLPGTSVLIKGSTTGTVVDYDGAFSLDIPTEGAILVLSFVGKQTVVANVAVKDFGTKNVSYSISYVNGPKGALSVNNDKFTFKMEEEVIEIHNATYTGAVPPPPPPIEAKEMTPPPPPPPPADGEREVFYVVEDMPKYPGGYATLQEYLRKMQKKIAVQKNIKGKAKVSFTVNQKGKVTDIKIIEKDNDGAAKGAVAIVNGMEDWSPGKQRGKAVRVKYLLPVEFK